MQEWIGEHAAPVQVLDERDRGEWHLAEPERVERLAGAQVVDQLVETTQVDGVLGEPTRAEHAHGDGERLHGRDAGVDQTAGARRGTPPRSTIWCTATTRAASWRRRPAVRPPTRYSASTARPSWVSSWPARAAGERRAAAGAQPLTKVTTCVPISWWSSASARAADDTRGRARRAGRRSTPSPRCSPRGARRATRCRARTPGTGRARPGRAARTRRRRATGRGRASRAGTVSQDVLGLVEQGGADGAVLLDAEGEELGRAPARQHLDQQEQLAVLGLQQVRHRRVLDVVERHVVEPGDRHGRVVARAAGTRTPVGDRCPRTSSRACDEVDRRDVEQEPEAGGDVGQRAVDREIRVRQRGRRSPRRRSIRSSSISRRGPRRRALPELVEVVLVDLAGPLVHEHLLELDRQRAAPARVALVDPAAELAALEPDVLPHVEPVAARPSRRRGRR